jgi:hypothetical protein
VVTVNDDGNLWRKVSPLGRCILVLFLALYLVGCAFLVGALAEAKLAPWLHWTIYLGGFVVAMFLCIAAAVIVERKFPRAPS